MGLNSASRYYIIPISTPVLLSTHELNESLSPNHLTGLLFPCCLIIFLYPKYVLLRILKFLLVKQTLNFLSVIISYFVCHWNCQLNFWNFRNLFRPPLSVSLIKHIFFFVIRTLSPIENFEAKVLPPNSGYKFLHTLFSFFLRLASFGDIFIYEWIVLLYWSTSKSSTSTYFVVLLAEKYLTIFP